MLFLSEKEENWELTEILIALVLKLITKFIIPNHQLVFSFYYVFQFFFYVSSLIPKALFLILRAIVHNSILFMLIHRFIIAVIPPIRNSRQVIILRKSSVYFQLPSILICCWLSILITPKFNFWGFNFMNWNRKVSIRHLRFISCFLKHWSILFPKENFAPLIIIIAKSLIQLGYSSIAIIHWFVFIFASHLC